MGWATKKEMKTIASYSLKIDEILSKFLLKNHDCFPDHAEIHAVEFGLLRSGRSGHRRRRRAAVENPLHEACRIEG